jgi:hypothetical protein
MALHSAHRLLAALQANAAARLVVKSSLRSLDESYGSVSCCWPSPRIKSRPRRKTPVKVTRGPEYRYLWIDSIYIVRPDNGGDQASKSALMLKVYYLFVCVHQCCH